MKPTNWLKRSQSLSVAILTLALATTSSGMPIGGPIAEAFDAGFGPMPGPTAADCTTAASVELTPNLGSFNTSPVQGFTGAICTRFWFEQQPGTEAFVRVALSVPVTPNITPVAATLARCSWTGDCNTPGNGNYSRLDDDMAAPRTWTSAVVSHPSTSTQRVNRFVEVQAVGIGTYTVTVAYGAIVLPESTNFNNLAKWKPVPVRANPAKAGVTGDWDHELSWEPNAYNDPSWTGLDACLPLSNQQDGIAGMLGIDAPNTPPGMTMPLGVPALTAAPGTSGLGPASPNNIRLGQRGVYINSRFGFDPAAVCAGGGADSDDWYKFTVDPGSQAVINAWPTRYDNYGGAFFAQLFVETPGAGLTFPPSSDGGPVPSLTILCGFTTLAPYEDVFNPATQCGAATSFTPTAPGAASAPTNYYLRIYGNGFVRYSMTIDYVGLGMPSKDGALASTGGTPAS